MTPPDSDAAIRHECQCGYRIVGRDAEGAHTWSKCRPDSGEREVCGAEYTRDGKLLVCREMPHHDPDHAMQVADRRRCAPRDPDTLFSIRRGLAQRILAALEDAMLLDLADELRALVTR